ncbi:hypothetical protein [Psychrobacter sp.]|uniref:hypothetical protein n=1 Tax=Psychrobacter sp. TaxID=56811 RepID=UPI0025D54643|nr:hypothetical protein [Psychrobacter sp.]
MVDTVINLAKIRVVVIAAKAQQRQAFEHTLTQWGLTVQDCIAPEHLEQIHFQSPAELWLIDSDYDEALYSALDTLVVNPDLHIKSDSWSDLNSNLNSNTSINTSPSPKKHLSGKPHVLVGFEPAPKVDEINLYAKWQRKLKRKLVSLLGLPTSVIQTAHTSAQRHQPWQKAVLLIVNSIGDIAAAQEFLNILPSKLPVVSLLAFDAQSVLNQCLHSLPKTLTKHNEWRCQVVDLSLNMQAGHCYILPPTIEVVCDSTGRLIVGDSASLAQIPMSLKQRIMSFSNVLAEQFIAIKFDSVNRLETLELNDHILSQGSVLWHQSPLSTRLTGINSNTVATLQATTIRSISATAPNLASYLTHFVNDTTEQL